MSALVIDPTGATCGARLRGVDLRQPVDADTAAQIRQAWLEHQVIAFPDQDLSIEELERFALTLGPRSPDPFIAALPGHPHVIEVRREADETSTIFAESWHSDWSFLPQPPAGTVLHGIVIPPVGGDTLFANQYAAYEALDAEDRAHLDSLQAIHSARGGYSKAGLYGERDQGGTRSMDIRPSDEALATQIHPLVRPHPETGRRALYISPGYTIGIVGMARAEATALLTRLFAHQVEERFIYRHRWASGMVTVWDNRCLLHAATGGYQGHRRLLRRVTLGEAAPTGDRRSFGAGNHLSPGR